MDRKWLAILALLSSGCASFSARPIPLLTPEALAASDSRGGVAVGAQGFLDSETSEIYFGADVTRGFLPVLFKVRNDGKGVLLVDRTSLRIVTGDGTKLGPVGSATMHAQFRHSVLTQTMVGGVVFGAAASDANDEMAADWRDKEFPAQLLVSPGQEAGGVVYFHRGQAQGPYAMEAVVVRMTTDEHTTFRLPLVGRLPGPK